MFDEDDYDMIEYGSADNGGCGLFFFCIIAGFLIFWVLV